MRCVFGRPGHTGRLHTVEVNYEHRVGIPGAELQFVDASNGETQFFHELSSRSLKSCLTRFEFAPWKLPQAAVPLVLWSLAYEESAIGVANDRCQDMNDFLAP